MPLGTVAIISISVSVSVSVNTPLSRNWNLNTIAIDAWCVWYVLEHVVHPSL